MTLPGGADVGDSPYTLKATFADVLDLVPQSSVKVDNVAIGRVQSIALDPGGHSATVTMVVREGLELPVGTTARLQQTSLLGEKYVALVRPEGAATTAAHLEDGDALPLDSTSQAVGVEQVLGALSLLLNGGGLGQFQEISRELQQVSTGRPQEIRAFLERTETFVRRLDRRRDSITTAIDGLAQLSTTLSGETPKIERALDGLGPGLQVLADQRQELVRMLVALDRLSEVSVRTLDRAQDDIVADLQRLDPILKGLADAGDDLPQALEILFTYPFPDSVLSAIKGDYLNVFATMNLATPGTVLLQPGSTGAAVAPGGLVPPTAASSSAAPSAPASSAASSGAASPSAAPSASGSASSPPLLLPPTTSAITGLPTSTITTPGTSGSPSPSGAGSSGPAPDVPGTTPASPTDPATSATPGETPSSGGTP